MSPGSFDDIRPISMTTLWSKILETLVARFTLDETSKNWKQDQFGGRKGSSTDHVLVGLWDKILTRLEEGARAIVLSAINFSKSFSRCAHKEILSAYQRLGLSDWGIEMHAAFFKNRQMKVKIGSMLSETKSVTGGAVQGSVLGVMDHNAVLEFINDDIEQNMYKYIDDLTLEEIISKEVDYISEWHEGKEGHLFRAGLTQKTFEELSEKCDLTGLKINDKKPNYSRF